MRTKLLAVMLAFVAVIGCKSMQRNGLKDEGFTRVEGRSYDEIIQKLTQLYSLGPEQAELVRKHLRSLILASFQLDCDQGTGTGFFTSADGHFVTAAHVINESTPDCSIRTAVETKEKTFTLRERKVNVEILYGSGNDEEEDLTYGRIEGIKNQNFVNILDKELADSFADSKLTIEVGFPMLTYRNGNESREERDAFSVVLKSIICDPAKIQLDFESRSHLLKKYFDSKKPSGAADQILKGYDVAAEDSIESYRKKIERNKIICEYFSKNRLNLEKKNYDQVMYTDELGMYISIGRIFGTKDDFVLADNDTIQGFSGSALFDLTTGAAIATLSCGVVPQGSNFSNPVSNAYFPDSIYSKASKARIDKHLADGANRMRDVCWCDLGVYSDVNFADTLRLKTPDLTCVPKYAEDSAYYCNSLNKGRRAIGKTDVNGANLYFFLDNCRPPVQARTNACSFLPGTSTSLYRNGRLLEKVKVDPRLKEYLLD